MKKIYGLSFLLAVLFLLGWWIPEQWVAADFTLKNLPPSLSHPFGTDWYGRNLFFRTLKGLSSSMLIGFITALGSAFFALTLAMISVLWKWGDYVLGFLIDCMMSMPHLVLQLLISYSLGGGFTGVLWSLLLTHWTSLARLFRGELMALRQSQWVAMSRKFGKSPWYIARYHLLPPLFPQLLVGMVLTFPHAILHEAALTFLGFGLSPEQSAIGVMIAESVNYLSNGTWWIFLSGFSLVGVVLLFDALGQSVKDYTQHKTPLPTEQ